MAYMAHNGTCVAWSSLLPRLLTRDGAASKCKCGVYAILYRSKTSNNTNWLFFGCPFFKIKHHHYDFFLWLDLHAVKFNKNEDVKAGEDEGVTDHFAKLNVENMLGDLEGRVVTIEKKKKSMNMFLIVMGLIVVVLSISVSRV
ncbi:hypothetical protein PIB30_086728 [Stylosanthes scabra]|uniref:Zinc finger GRF-type domain-containing protein n=1 Tax=Stylosanthes scabra TaxID=79078 RepID=A0ABU6RU59_9FABA|nr:hypothetical protein [Stylosanthes scabra]